MHFQKVAWATAGLALALAVAGAAWAWQMQNRLYSSATALRTNSTYLQAHAPAVRRFPTPPEVFGRIQVSSTTNEIKIAFPAEEHSPFAPDYEPLHTHKADSANIVRIGDGSVRLAFVGVATSAPPGPHGAEVPLRIFTPGLVPATKEQTAGVLPSFEQKTWVHDDVPVARFFFALSNPPPLMPRRMEIFDGRTQWPLSGSGSTAQLQHQPLIWFEKQLRLWHQTPLELVVTMIGGPERIFTLAPKVGEEARFDGCHVRVLAMSHLGNNSLGSTGDGKTNRCTIRLDQGPAWDNKPRCTIVLHAVFPGEIDFLGADGRKLPTGGMNSSGNLMTHTVVARLKDVRAIRVRYLPETHRMLFSLPELPGLPEVNRGIENLFDVRVPELRFRYEHAFQLTIGQLAQMQIMHLPLTYPNGYFPATRSNTTPRELFIEMAGMLSNPEDHLLADPVKNVIEARKHPLRVLLHKAKQRFGL